MLHHHRVDILTTNPHHTLIDPPYLSHNYNYTGLTKTIARERCHTIVLAQRTIKLATATRPLLLLSYFSDLSAYVLFSSTPWGHGFNEAGGGGVQATEG